jgi:predicted ATP-dependent serine protease
VRSKEFTCRHCGKRFPKTLGAGLCCGDDCQTEYAKHAETISDQLSAAGFEQSSEAPNMWSKDNVSITIEEVKHVGLDEAIRKHGAVVQELSNSQ